MLYRFSKKTEAPDTAKAGVAQTPYLEHPERF